MLHYHGQVLREYRAAKAANAVSLPAWREALKASAQFCREWLRMMRGDGKVYGLLHVTNTDRRAFANVETP